MQRVCTVGGFPSSPTLLLKPNIKHLLTHLSNIFHAVTLFNASDMVGEKAKCLPSRK